MSATSISPVATEPGGRSRPGFSAANVTVRSAGRTPSPGRAGRAVDAARDVDGEHRGVARVGRRPRAVEARAERGVDDEVGRRQPGRRVGDVDHAHGRAGTGQAPRRRPTVVAVVPLAGEHDDATPVRPAHHPRGGAGHGGAGPLDQHLDRLRRGGVDRRHLRRRDDRDHRPTVPRPAAVPLDVSARPLGAGATASAASTAGTRTGGSGRTGLDSTGLRWLKRSKPARPW